MTKLKVSTLFPMLVTWEETNQSVIFFVDFTKKKVWDINGQLALESVADVIFGDIADQQEAMQVDPPSSEIIEAATKRFHQAQGSYILGSEQTKSWREPS